MYIFKHGAVLKPLVVLFVLAVSANAGLPGFENVQLRAFGLTNLTRDYYYIVTSGVGSPLASVGAPEDRHQYCRVEPAGASGHADKTGFHAYGLMGFFVGKTYGRYDYPDVIYWVPLSLMPGVRQFPLDGNWNFQVDGSALIIQSDYSWCPECRDYAPMYTFKPIKLTDAQRLQTIRGNPPW